MAAFLVVAFGCEPPQNTGGDVSPTASESASASTAPSAAGPLVASGAFHGGEVGVAYSPVALTASGGTAPYTWSVGGGSLPAGLLLGGDGTVSGQPTTPCKFAFTLQVADAAGSTAQIKGTMGIAAALTAKLIPACAKYCVVEIGCINVCGG